MARTKTAIEDRTLAPDAPTFRDEIDRFVNSKRAKRVKPATLYTYRKELERFADYVEIV
ncbi:MAG: hypothetical protein IIB19_04290, partial [Chloroflexi bacterium]|nr:hypothetical protein [Chloroflexota bacterium]